MAAELDRRSFNQSVLAAAIGLAFPGCGADDDRYSEADAAALEAHRRDELEASGTGPYGPQVYRGYRGLAEMPWFDLDGAGRLICTVEDLPPVIDMHAHLGMSMLFAPEIDLLSPTPPVRHILDCDAQDPGCRLDLDVYANANFTAADLWALRRGAVAQLSIGSSAAATHTIPNLIEELDAMRIAQAVIHPIAFGLPFGDDLTERFGAAIKAAGVGDRLIPGCSVHPRDDGAIEKLRRYAAAGARIIKLHPAGQRFFPDSPEAMVIYEECQNLGIAVFFHGGRAGIEPEYAHPFNLIRHYEPALKRFPGLPFVLGHGGARDVAGAIPLLERYPNCWFEIHGQGVTVLRQIVERVDGRRLLFGTDWPFYHLAMSLAKVLMVTEDRPDWRRAILRENADLLLSP
ncbi:MAG: amidohydrolase family protein [bacterium]|nr:amidohydrolase family protein [bacterium]